MSLDRGKQQHRNAAARDQHVAAGRDQRARLFGEQLDDIGGKRFGFVGLQDLSGLEGHRVYAGHAPLQPVFADLVVKPGDVARIDGDDAGPLAELAGVKHRGFAQRHHRDINHGAGFIKPGILEVSDDESVIALALRLHRVADHLPRAAEFDDRMGVIVVRGNALDVDCRPWISDDREMSAQPIPIELAVLLIDVALIPDANRVHRFSLSGFAKG